MVDLQRAVLSLLPWYLRWPLKLLGGIAGAISAAVQWMWRHPWQTLAAAALLAFAWAWHGWGVAEKWGRQQQQLAQHWKIKFVDGTAGGESVRCEGDGGAADVPVLSALSEGAGGALRAGELAIVDDRDAMICTANSLRLHKLIEAGDSAASGDVNAQDLSPLTE